VWNLGAGSPNASTCISRKGCLPGESNGEILIADGRRQQSQLDENEDTDIEHVTLKISPLK